MSRVGHFDNRRTRHSAVNESDFQDAMTNLERLWRGLGESEVEEFRQLLRQFLAGEFSQAQ